MTETRARPDEPQHSSATQAGWRGRSLQRLVEHFDKVSAAAIIVTMICMTVIVVVQVIARYVFDYSIDSATGLSRLLFVWSMFLAIPHGLKHGVHVGIDLAVNLLPPTAREFVFRLTSAAAMALMIAVAIAAWKATIGNWQQLMPTLPITNAVFYIPVLIGAIHSLVHLLLLTWGGSSIWEDRDL